jgi:O-antigen/teichoic acid export membrane protein
MSLRRVSYPAMSRLVGAGEDLRETVERTAGLAAVSSGFVLVPLAGCAAALIPLVFGAPWTDAAVIVPGLCLGQLVGGPTSVAVAAYLLAADRAGVVLRSAILRVAAMLVVGLSLLAFIGVVGLGIGYAAAALVEALILASAARRALGVRLGRALAPSCLSAVLAGGAGMAITVAGGSDALSGAAGATISLGLFAAAVWMLNRDVLLDALRLIRSLVARRRGATPVEPPVAAEAPGGGSR